MHDLVSDDAITPRRAGRIVAPAVARLRIYPFKSFDGADVASSELTLRGGFRLDRAFALFDADGGYVNGKREPRVHRIRVSYDERLAAATFAGPSGARHRFALAGGDVTALSAFLSRELERPVEIRRDDDGGFPDDAKAPGPTIVSTATLAEVASWFDGLTAADVRLRLRANVEIGGVPAFWEDRLFGPAGTLAVFHIGTASFGGTNPCARCVVPSRDARTGAVTPAFSKTFAERRAATLPPWADRSRFDHFYRLTINTRTLASGGETVQVGDGVVLEPEPRAV